MLKVAKIIGAVLLLLFWVESSEAVETRRWELSEFRDWSEGEAQSVEISSRGTLKPAAGIKSMDIPAEGVWSMLETSRGLFLGTGNQGKLLLVKNNRVEKEWDTGKIAIPAIAAGPEGDIFFAAIPQAVIYRLDRNGNLEEFATPGNEYVWDLAFTNGRLLAAAGAEARVLKFSPAGKLEAEIEIPEEHVMCLETGRGKVFAGTAGEGLLIELTGDTFRVIQDFEEKEIKDMVWMDDPEVLVVAANSEVGAPPPSPPSVRPRAGTEPPKKAEEGEEPEGEKEEQEPGPSIPVLQQPRRGKARVNSAVYAVTLEGRVRRILQLSNRATVALAAVGSSIFVATDQQGKVYQVQPDSSEYAIAFDLEPAQVLSLLPGKQGPAWMGTGAPATLIKVKNLPDGKASYTTKVFDAQFPASFGKAAVEADGPVVLFARSGNLENPEKGWSNWKPAPPGTKVAIPAPPARFLQVKLEWPLGSRAEVSSLSIPYRIFNQPHYIEKIEVDSTDQDGKDEGEDKRRITLSRAKKKGNKEPAAHETTRKIAWKVENPDNDELEFRLFYQPEGSKKWIPITTPEPLTKTRFEWETASVPDGWYRIKVIATDQPSNPPGQALEASAVSDRFLVDNTPPEFSGVSISRGRLKGKVKDKTSEISLVQFSIDGGDWLNAEPEDGLFDEKAESFFAEIPSSLQAGPHVIGVRAWDRGMNLAVDKAFFQKD